MRARGPKAKPEGKGWEVRWRQVWAEPRKGIQPKLCMETTVVSKEVQELRDRIGVSGADIGHVWREGRVRGPTWGKRDTERGIPPTRHRKAPGCFRKRCSLSPVNEGTWGWLPGEELAKAQSRVPDLGGGRTEGLSGPGWAELRVPKTSRWGSDEFWLRGSVWGRWGTP